MSTALERTKALQRTFLPVDTLEPDPMNPNEMGEAEFNMLYDNVEKAGLTDPILIRKKRPEEITEEAPLEYRIIGGHHRWEVAKLHGIDEVPVTIIDDPDFTEDQAKFQMVRHNIIHGAMSPKKFMKLYESLQGKYTEELAAELFGFTDEEEFKKLVQSTAQALPPEMKQSFLDASKEIRTIDDLAVVLNRLFSAYGDTVPYGYMIFDFGGNDHIWLRMDKKQKTHMTQLGKYCMEKNRTVDKAMTVLMQLIAQGTLSQEKFEEEFLKHPEVTITGTEVEIPTEDYLASLDSSTQL